MHFVPFGGAQAAKLDTGNHVTGKPCSKARARSDLPHRKTGVRYTAGVRRPARQRRGAVTTSEHRIRHITPPAATVSSVCHERLQQPRQTGQVLSVANRSLPAPIDPLPISSALMIRPDHPRFTPSHQMTKAPLVRYYSDLAGTGHVATIF